MSIEEAISRIEKLCGHRPEPTLDSLAALWPEGYRWVRFSDEWQAYDESGYDKQVACVTDTGNELHDRLFLTLAVLENTTNEGRIDAKSE